MKTNIIKIDNPIENTRKVEEAAALLRDNEVVAFPTETVYGLGANAKSDEAVKKIFEAKGRPSDNPLIVHISNAGQLEELVEHVPDKARMLMDAFWPGPLTLVFPKKEVLSKTATAGLDTVAIRMPNHPLALALIEAADLPIAAPSANLSGKPSPTTAQHVDKDLNGRIRCIVDGGETGVGVESTVVDCTEEIPVILRPGGVTKEAIENIIGPIGEDPALHNAADIPKSPGMKYTHYAPDAPFVLVDGDKELIQQLVNEKRRNGLRTGVLTTEENKDFFDADVVVVCGQRQELETVAAHLYDALRAFDDERVDCIYGEMFPTDGIGSAIMNRLLKAAGHSVYRKDR
ncbi:MAG: L-threonylcarbamoyladenylate synthase [Bacillus sp. (in: firmicutes)]